jgi:ATP-dependent Clp endopeptidase proteolytic subunit ClpP
MMKTIQVENKQGKVKLNEVVTRESIGRMIDEISKLFGAKAVADGADFGEIMNVAENAVDVLDIEINSPGGSVFDGYTVYQEIKSLQDRGVVVNATITGMAASMASVICMACNKVSIVPHGRMMIHDASSGFSGNADQMRKQADLLDSISSDIANIYSSRTKKPVEDIRAMMKKETWMDAKTTVDNGFADEIAEKKLNVSNNLTAVLDIVDEKGNKSPMSILTKLFPNNDQVANLENAIQENDSLLAEIADLQAKLETAKKVDQTLIENTVKIENLTAELATAQSELETVKAELEETKAAVVVEAESASDKAIEMLAGIGQSDPLPIENGGEQRSILEQFESLKGSEATAFYKANRKAILSEQSKRK